ncbi:MAG: InlB B-repeat-containing protein [Clostridia bacterium]|nr:InlB B-repeat-containing protein [Clostridia bacterium]
MKRIITMILAFIIFLSQQCLIEANDFFSSPGFYGVVAVYDEYGEEQRREYLEIMVTFEESGKIGPYSKFYTKSKEAFENLDDKAKQLILSNIGENEQICVMNFAEEDGVYPKFEIMDVNVYTQRVGGGRPTLLGKDYRLYYLDCERLTEVPIRNSNIEGIRYETDKLGMYILYYNKKAYDVKFYDEYPEDEVEPFYVVENLGEKDIVEFPDIPRKDGYVFTGWKQNRMQGWYDTFFYIKPQNITAFDLLRVYASWCPVDEYTPLEVTIESEKTIKKGKEDGSEVILTLSEGMFDETLDEDIENDWKIVGNNELSISSVERIDDTTVKLTLSGDSTDKYKKGEIQIEFNSELYISHEGFENNYEVHEIADIQLDENGIKREMFISDNSITLEKQKRSNSGSGIEKHTITFETNGGEELQSLRIANGHTLEEPKTILKEGYVFAGWYTDDELTNAYNFDDRVTDSFTLYAAWEKPEFKEPYNKQIVLPIKIIEKAIEFVKSVVK